jgi:hypothetical protein
VIRDSQRKSEEFIPDCPAGASQALGPLIAATAGLAAAWIAAGSTGLLAHPLRRALTLTALGVVILAPRPFPWRRSKGIFALLTTVGLAAYMTASSLPVISVLGVSFVVASLAVTFRGQAKKVLCIVSAAVGIFGLYRMACTGIPFVWSMADALGRAIGSAGGLIVGQSVYVGAAFAGLDFLVLMSVLWIIWIVSSPPPRAKRALYGFAAIFGGHICYLIVLSYIPQILAGVVEPVEQTGFSWAVLFHKAIPWNLPLLACVIHLIIASTMFRWSAGPVENETSDTKAPVANTMNQKILRYAVPALAILLPVIIALYPGKSDLQGKKIVFYEKGFLNWLKPTHGQYGRLSSGMYGMLPVFIESLGASSLISPDLSDKDLQDADALVLLFPDEPWVEGQLDRIWNFVRQGGSLLVMGEHTTRDENGSNRFNEVLEPTSIQVEFDSGTFAVGGWLQSYEAIAHPATTGVPDDRNQFGVVIGASLETSYPARPLLIGRWGWSDMGDEGSGRAMMGNGHYDSGEKLGDLILAAEQPLGKGRVIAFGDTSGLTNGINVSSHVFTSRLFGYLAGGGANAHPIWRQFLGILACGLLISLLVRNTGEGKLILVTLCLACSLTVCTSISHSAGEILPDGRYKLPNNLAYIDTSHLEANSGESWRPEGIGGFILTLMRNGYLTLSLPELTAERLVRSDLLVSVAPSHSFSKTEQNAIREFVLDGGTFIIMAGFVEAGPSRSLLSMLGFSIGYPGPNPVEPVPMGHFKSPYLETPSGDKRVHVRFHAAWPVTCNAPDAEEIAFGHNDLPVIILRKFGAGKVVVIGDTCFVANKNLEWEGGEPFEGMRENADFWRWFVTRLRDQEMWIPPTLQSQPESANNQTTPGISNQEVAN